MPKNNKTKQQQPLEKFSEAEGLIKLRELVLREQAEKGLKCPVDDEFLIRFLRARKGDPYSGLNGIQSYYKMRDSIPHVKEMLNPESLKNFLKSNMFVLLKEKDAKGRPIAYVRTGNWNVDEVAFEEFYLGCYLISEELTSYEHTQLNGIVVIVDHAGLSLNLMRKIASQLSLTNIRRIINLFQGAFPARFKDAHVINHPFIFDMLYRLGKPFMNEKLKKRTHEHGKNVENIQAHISPDILPQSLLGNVPDEECISEEFFERLMSKQEYYKEMASYGYL